MKIGIVTGGGDCPGLNAVIRAVAKTAAKRGWETLGIIGGYDGLLSPQNYRLLDYKALDALAVRLRKAGADLARDRQRLSLRHWSFAANPIRKSLPVDELHREKLHFAKRRGSHVQIVHLADVEVAHLAGGAHFGRQAIPIPRLGAFEGDAPVQFRVHGFVYKAHAASAHCAHDTESLQQQGPGAKRVEAAGFQRGPAGKLIRAGSARRIYRWQVRRKIAGGMPGKHRFNFAAQLLITLTGLGQKGAALARLPLQRGAIEPFELPPAFGVHHRRPHSEPY